MESCTNAIMILLYSDVWTRRRQRKLWKICMMVSLGLTLADILWPRKILRVGYYWSTMETDCHHHSRTCHNCQIYADKVHVPPIPLNVMTAPWPFAMWGIEMIGEIKPTASNGHFFILVTTAYFTT